MQFRQTLAALSFAVLGAFGVAGTVHADGLKITLHNKTKLDLHVMIWDGVADHHEDDNGDWFDGHLAANGTSATTSDVKHCPFAIFLFAPDGEIYEKVFQDNHKDNACTLTDIDVTDKDDKHKKDSHHHGH